MNDQPKQHQTHSTRGGDGKYIRTPETAERDARAAELRGRGWSYRRIAAELGVDVRAAHDAVQRALRAIVEESATQARQMELERLDRLYEAALGVLERHHITVSNGRVVRMDGEALPDDGPVLQAIDRLVKISESRRKLLGLDAPVKADIGGKVTYEIVGIPEANL